jgi:hypothetical protein
MSWFPNLAVFWQRFSTGTGLFSERRSQQKHGRACNAGSTATLLPTVVLNSVQNGSKCRLSNTHPGLLLATQDAAN